MGVSLIAAIASVVLADCKAGAPKGQVVAVVNGQEVTVQDLASDARSSAGQQGQSPQAVLQHVIARVLLAQAAHNRHLDRYPGYPSDVARIQQDFLAQKALQATMKPVVKPTTGQIAGFIAAHPNIFENRTRFQADEIKFQSADNLKSLNGASTIAAVASRLQSLNVPFDRQAKAIDTAELPSALVMKLMVLPPGQIFFLREGDAVMGIVLQSRTAVTMTAEQQDALATQLLSRISTQSQIDANLKALRSSAKIVYQSGYAPISRPNPAGTPKANAPQS